MLDSYIILELQYYFSSIFTVSNFVNKYNVKLMCIIFSTGGPAPKINSTDTSGNYFCF